MFSPPEVEGVCDACGGELYQRDDDKPETIKARLRVFHEQTAPLIQYYKDKNILIEVDGSGDIDAVTTELKGAVDGLKT
jgi:adenylate kinase